MDTRAQIQLLDYSEHMKQVTIQKGLFTQGTN